jgi:hypothetical protein
MSAPAAGLFENLLLQIDLAPMFQSSGNQAGFARSIFLQPLALNFGTDAE